MSHKSLSDSQLKNILDAFPHNNPNPVLLLDKNGNVQFANEAAIKAFDEYGLQIGGPFSDAIGSLLYKELTTSNREVEVKLGELYFAFSSASSDDPNSFFVFGNNVTNKFLAQRNLAKLFDQSVLTLGKIVEARDPYTEGHSLNVSKITKDIASQLSFSDFDLKGLEVCGKLHDIGKIIVPGSILHKPGKLNEYERGLIKLHPSTAKQFLSLVEFPWPIAEVVSQHHERIDGSGYPSGLRGEEINLWARILSVADVMDAMIAYRPYRQAREIKELIFELLDGAGTKYDEKVVDIAVKLICEKQKKVCIVDDDEEILDVYATALVKKGFSVKKFTEPLEVVSYFSKNSSAILITDMAMPELNGIELSFKIHSISPETKILMITGYAEKKDVISAMKNGVDAILEKPITIEELIKAVNVFYVEKTGISCA